jgi:hypothetical protein
MTAYRWLFGLAALCDLIYCVGLGFFRVPFLALFGAEPSGPPENWTVLAVLTGFLALLYASVAFRPERGTPLIAFGLLTKVLSPVAWVVAVAKGQQPPQTFPLVLIGDLIWWFPFLWYLVRDLPSRRAVIAWTGVAFHILASLALLAVSGGVEVEPDRAARSRWVLGHVPLWVGTWMLWALASMSLLAFCAAWAGRLLELQAPPAWAVGSCLVCAVGVLCDLVGESVNLVGSTRPGLSLEDFRQAARTYALLSAGTANGLYCVGGLVLSRLSWRVGFLRGLVGWLGVAMWVTGLVLTAVVVLELEVGMIAAGAVVMLLYIPWATLVGWRLRDAPGHSTSQRTILPSSVPAAPIMPSGLKATDPSPPA